VIKTGDPLFLLMLTTYMYVYV